MAYFNKPIIEYVKKEILDESDVEQIVAKITKIPEKSITTNDRYYLKDLDKNFLNG